ncbi:MAG TPA: universal stress protein [Gemmataceae bacterium]|nr:universal stress protein [Gemmataceae bacterium]
MFLSLMVPLDRSSFAEQALPLALSIARRAKARLDLVEVHALYDLEDPTAGWTPFEFDQDAECRQQEQLYLDATAKWASSASSVSVAASVLPGSAVLPATVADSLLERARTGKADLIVMTTHGRASLSRFGLGSVTDELIRRATIPLLLVRPSEKAPGIIPEPVVDDILIPLDGSTLAEQVLEPALELARLMEARCSLLRVVESRSPAGNGNPGEPVEKAQAYLDGVAGRIREQGLQVRTRVVVARHAAEAISEVAQASELVAVATHGRGGLKRLLLGSVADKLIQDATSPVLVYRPTDERQ